ncbi:bifunctional homocysteine S-methyltransferase/methylenetetrahydrofolate reductase [Shouchella shacheensis]|uniref:bifunctional homocysteine S-methyltransferase/methylenetetrahydrofolate reductase n=1 Tax=Shouchella shacheensis TaxID=1649580 RepID=UPI00073FB69D|nr:bifunctional homocysteine S-methyltransferase/methylenetetrahydrofolate reductase [Shouchella shacheensis]
MSLLETLKSEIVIGDGAMGTLLYEKGYDLCFEELSVSDPDVVKDVHLEYVQAGAGLIQTNTYAANRIKLSKYSLEEATSTINQAAARLAKEAAGEKVYVVGTVGGIRGFQYEEVTLAEIEEAFREQIRALLEAGVDGLLLETFYDLEEAKLAVTLSKSLSEKPVIVNVSLGDIGVLKGGITLTDALKQLRELGADVVGINCRMGPYHMLRSLEGVELEGDVLLACYPNASLPGYRDGRFVYASNPEYFADMAGRFVDQGVRLIGGCCGTTPAHIREISKAVQARTPLKRSRLSWQRQEPIYTEEPRRVGEKIHEIPKRRTSVIVELDPPKKLNIVTFIEGARALKEAGADALTMADNSLASPRVDNKALATIVREQVGIRPLVHLTCRDRNLIGLQSHLMGLDVLGFHDILAITGDPSKIGDFPGATSVYDLSSLRLMPMIKQMNEGISFSGKSLGRKTEFSVGAALNPNVKHLDKAVKRMEKKIEAGADYFMTQPIYDESQFEALYEATRHLEAPIYVGIMPLVNSRNAEFLHNEVPGITLTDATRQAMARCGDNKELAQKEGLTMAKSLVDAAKTYFNGIYLITPFLRYQMTAELTRHITEKEMVEQGREA